MYDRLSAAWSIRFRQLILESNSLELVKMLTKSFGTVPTSTLARSVKDLLRKEWQVAVTHVYKEANMMANCMAQLAIKQELGFRYAATTTGGTNSFVASRLRG